MSSFRTARYLIIISLTKTSVKSCTSFFSVYCRIVFSTRVVLRGKMRLSFAYVANIRMLILYSSRCSPSISIASARYSCSSLRLGSMLLRQASISIEPLSSVGARSRSTTCANSCAISSISLSGKRKFGGPNFGVRFQYLSMSVRARYKRSRFKARFTPSPRASGRTACWFRAHGTRKDCTESAFPLEGSHTSRGCDRGSRPLAGF